MGRTGGGWGGRGGGRVGLLGEGVEYPLQNRKRDRNGSPETEFRSCVKVDEVAVLGSPS